MIGALIALAIAWLILTVALALLGVAYAAVPAWRTVPVEAAAFVLWLVGSAAGITASIMLISWLGGVVWA